MTETPIEIQLRALRKTLGDDLVQDLEDSVAPNTWRAYRSDLANFATWVAYTGADWAGTRSRRRLSPHPRGPHQTPPGRSHSPGDPPPPEHRPGSSQPPHFPATPPGPVGDRHRHRRGDARRGGAVGRLVRGAAPLRARRSATPPPVTGPTASCCNSPDQKRRRTIRCGCRLPTNPTRTGTRLPASRTGSRRRLDSDRPPPRRSGCT